MAFSRCFPCLLASVAVGWTGGRDPLSKPVSCQTGTRAWPGMTGRGSRCESAMDAASPGVFERFVRASSAHAAACRSPGTWPAPVSRCRCLVCGGAASQSRTKIVSDTTCRRAAEILSGVVSARRPKFGVWKDSVWRPECRRINDKHGAAAACMDSAAGAFGLKAGFRDHETVMCTFNKHGYGL